MIKTTIVGFGDSITYGYGVDSKINYISRFSRFLPEYFPLIQWNIVNSGVNGDTTREGLERINRDVLAHNPHIVLIMLGSNDCAFDEEQFRSKEEFQTNLEKIVTLTLKHNNHSGLNASHPVAVLVTPPPMVDTTFFPFTTNERLQEYSVIIKKVAKKQHCPLVDFFNYMTQESDGKIEAFTQSDGIHLNSAGYSCLYDCLFSTLTQLIDAEGILHDMPIDSDTLYNY